MRITDFKGLWSGVDPIDVPIGGARFQNNVATNEPGRLRVRRGIQPATFTSTSEIQIAAFNTFRPLCFVRARNGDVFAYNGINQGVRYDGMTGAVELSGLAAPPSEPTVASPTGGAATAGDYTVGFQYIDDTIVDVDVYPHALFSLPGWPSNLSPLATHTAADNDRFTYSDLTAPSETRSVYRRVWRSASDESNVLYHVGDLDRTGVVVSSADGGTGVALTLRNTDGLQVGVVITVTGHSVGGYNTTHRITAIDDLVVTTDVSYSSDGTGGSWESTSINDQASDTELQSRELLVVTLEDGNLSGYRFVPPPTDRPIVVWFQDRMWFGGNVRYNAGTVATNGSATITGTDTAWTEQMVGRLIRIDGESEPLEIVAYGSATSLTTHKAASTSASGKSYVIHSKPTRKRSLNYSEIDEPESVSETNIVTLQENTGDDDEVTAMIPRGSYLYIATDRHKYALAYARQPRIDASVVMVDDRGALNQDCWDSLDDLIYLMDDAGPYVFNGGKSQALDGPINDLWRGEGDETIDFSKSAGFHVAVDRRRGRVYFFVAFTGDSGTYPTRALVFNVRTKTWDLNEYSQELASSIAAQIDGQTRLLVAGELETVFIADEGTTDVATAEITGTVTSASSTSLVDSGASFPASIVGAYVYITAGTGKGQYRKITARNSTTLTVAAWTTTPDTTSEYLIGAIPWEWRSGQMPLASGEGYMDRYAGVSFRPTSGDASLDMRFFFNHETSPEQFARDLELGDAVLVESDNLSDARVFLKSTRDANENAVGYEQFHFGGTVESRMHTDRWISLQLRGAQGDDDILIGELEVTGVVGGG